MIERENDNEAMICYFRMKRATYERNEGVGRAIMVGLKSYFWERSAWEAVVLGPKLRNVESM